MQEPVELARELARIARENQLAEIEYREDDTVLKLVFQSRRRTEVVAVAPAAVAATAAPAEAATAPASTSPPAVSGGPSVISPLAGVFYCAPRPNAPPFVEVGQTVASGQTLCIVEAMKLMNEIAAEGPMRIRKVLVENGQVIEAGQALFEYEPLG
jgi:acetyl-CoA carboxylase biotin carboxyl carrier protein